MSDLSLDDFKAVATLAETRNYGRAAAALGVTQPTLSSRIARIESDLGALLFTRGRNGAEPTPAGEALVDVARRTLAAASEAAHAVKFAASGRFKRLRLGCTTIAARDVVIPVLRAFRAAEPDAAIFLVDAHSHDLEAMLEEGALDVAFLHPPLHRSGLAERLVGKHPLVTVRGADHAGARGSEPVDVTTITDLVGYPRVSAPNLISAFYRAVEAQGHSFEVTHEGTSGAAVTMLAAAGYGTAIIAEGQATPEDVVVAPLAGYPVPLETVVSWRQKDHRAIVRAFLATVAATLGER